MHHPIVLTGSYSSQMDTVFASARHILYQRGGNLVRIRNNQIDELTATSLQAHLIDHLTPVTTKLTKEGDEIETPQKKFERDLCQHMIDRTDVNLPPLDYVYRCPVFAGDWEPIGEHGYHETARAWLNTDALEGADLLPLKQAVAIIDDLLSEFPFADAASKSNAVAAMITPFIRPMVGLMPLFTITAPTEGSGKTLLADIIARIGDGTPITKITAPSDDDEWRKRITSTLMQAPACILLDNVVNLDSASLAAVLTARIWTDRLLGSTRNVSIPNNAVWFASGNNPTVSAEMSRRCVPIRLVPDTDNPGARKFKRDIERYTDENRALLVSACMTLIYQWAQTRPTVDVSMGSYQQWATAAASIVHHAGYTDALSNRGTLRTEDSAELLSFVEVWSERPDIRRNATASDLERMCEDAEMLAHIRGGSSHRAARAKKLSTYLGTHADRVCGGFRICATVDSHTKNRVYSLEKI